MSVSVELQVLQMPVLTSMIINAIGDHDVLYNTPPAVSSASHSPSHMSLASFAELPHLLAPVRMAFTPHHFTIALAQDKGCHTTIVCHSQGYDTN